MDIYIHGYSTVSAFSDDSSKHNLIEIPYLNESIYAGKIQIEKEKEIQDFIRKNSQFQKQDRSIQLALFVSKSLKENINLGLDKTCGVNFSSSRGATGFWEDEHTKFIQKQEVSPRTSPYTTLGNLSSIVSSYLQTTDFAFSHSMACTGFALSLLNAIAWLKSGMTDQMLIGASEAPLTPFTIAQFKALKIYSELKDDYPCKAGLLNKEQNTMVLGEAACAFLINTEPKNATAKIKSLGYAMESNSHPAGISSNAKHIQTAMKNALNKAELGTVDLIITHTPGTKKGDNAELIAIQNTFENLPLLTNNKWKVGHTFASSSGLSLAYALGILKTNKIIQPEYLPQINNSKKIRTIMINSAGFGGQAVSFIIESVQD